MKKLLVLVIVFLAFSATFLSAKDKSSVDNKKLNAVIKLSGVGDIAKSLPIQFKNGLAQKKEKLGEKAYNSMVKAIDKTLGNEKKVNRYMKKKFSKELNNKQLSKIIKSYKTPLFKKIKKLEQAAMDPDYQQKLKTYVEGLGQTPPDPKRVALIQDLERSANVVETQVLMAVGLSKSLMMGMQDDLKAALKKSGKKAETHEEMSKEVDQILLPLENQIRVQLSKFTLITLLYTYNNLTDKEVKDYIGFLKSKEGQGMSKAMMATLKGLFNKTGKALGKGMTKTLTKKTK